MNYFAFDYFSIYFVYFYNITFSADKEVYNGGEEIDEELLDSDHQVDQQSFDEQECDKEDISEGKEGCENETPGQKHGEINK